jgi:uncharacterized membrane protein YgdD (TMEM256/DUF423 family)
MQSKIIQTSAIFGILAVSIGAFGAHGLKMILTVNHTLAAFNTGVEYHFYHTLALLALGVLAQTNPSVYIKRAAVAFSVGIVLFSGSLYVLAISGIKMLGAITPLGGVAFIVGWVFLFLAVGKKHLD